MKYIYVYETDRFEIYFPNNVKRTTYLDEFIVVEGDNRAFYEGAAFAVASTIKNSIGLNPTQKELDAFTRRICRKQNAPPKGGTQCPWCGGFCDGDVCGCGATRQGGDIIV